MNKSLILFPRLQSGKFLFRPNRFTVIFQKEGKEERGFLPNPGRLWEILLPGTNLFLTERENQKEEMRYVVVGAEKEGRPILLHTQKTNDVAQFLIERGLVPGLEGSQVMKREVKSGKSRLDFLLRQGGQEIFLEVKSCTLFAGKVAMFPDAITERGRRHLLELAELSDEETRGKVLFLVHSPEVDFFLPDYHTDLAFSQTMLSLRDKIEFIPLYVGWNYDLTLEEKVNRLTIPWDLLEKEARDQGSYILILHLAREEKIKVGELGSLFFPPGFYLYVGSAQRNLTQRMERHRRKRKNCRWHIDYLRERSEWISALPFRTADKIECALAQDLSKLADFQIPSFGSSDCSCPTHLFGFREDPFRRKDFIRFLSFWRMERLFN